MPFFGPSIRNGLPIGLGSIAGFGVAPAAFSPADLFSAGEQGAWYDPSDLTTLFQDSAGTTPVTGVEQVVGLMLDKSKGLATTNLPFTGFINNNMDSVSGSGSGPWNIVETAGYGIAYSGANFYVTTGETIRVQFSITFVSGSISIFIGNTNGGNTDSNKPTFNVSGLYTVYLRASSTGFNRNICLESGNCNCSITIVSVDRIAGNHATATGSARPLLSARYNLLTRTEEFDNAAWGKTAIGVAVPVVTANQGTAPDGTNTADKVDYPAIVNAADTSRLFQSYTSLATTYNGSIYLKAFASGDVGKKIILWLFDSVPRGTQVVTLTSDWQRVTATSALAAGTSYITISASGSDFGGVNQGAVSVLIWGAQLLTAADQTATGGAYQRVAAATNYATVSTMGGYSFLPYLNFAGAQAMSTGAVDFSATKQITPFGGYSIITGTGSQTLVELTNNAYTTSGGFSCGQGTNAASSGFGFLMNTGAGIAGQTANISVPYTSVFSYEFDSLQSGLANEAKLRLNAVAQTYTSTTGTDSGTGTFANAALNIGCRAATTAPTAYVNGRIYSLIVRGAQSSAAQISSTESWVNGKTGAY